MREAIMIFVVFLCFMSIDIVVPMIANSSLLVYVYLGVIIGICTSTFLLLFTNFFEGFKS